ncbi:very short patch repair endonuclease [Afifella sp. YEN Y35]|uniref:very short patch repair endonuclease n=1 Tax=Afifella sp. YEN Y35 TaxID=3388337 RepID=UPI0039E0200A
MGQPVPTTAERSALMGRVRQKETSPELRIASLLRELGVGYRKNVRALPGSPDFANRKRRWAIFVNGCYWHHHTNCRKATVPKANRDFWWAKFERNRQRDARAIRELRRAGYRVAVIWECQGEEARKRVLKLTEPSRIDVGQTVDK